MSWFFNCDLEDFLKSGKNRYEIQSNKFNQEFEYFILWLENEALYSTKKYRSEFLDFVSTYNNCSVVTTKNNDVKNWCVPIYNIEEQKKLNSKIETTRFAIKNNLAHKNTQIIDETCDLEDGYLYKEAYGVSGIGTWKIHSKPKTVTFPLVKDPLLKRTFDFSSLIDGRDMYMYQNHIDDHFQYRGTTIGLNFDYFDWIEEYKINIEKIKKVFSSIHTPMSIDSFLYSENNEEKVYTLSEVNNRKTMGFIALKLKEKLFQNYRYMRLRIFSINQLKRDYSYKDLVLQFDKKVIPLSPIENRFLTFALAEDSLGELNELEDLLISTFFKEA